MLSRRKQRTDEEDKLLKLLQGIKTPQDGFTTWCEQMLHALNTQANNTSSPLDGKNGGLLLLLPPPPPPPNPQHHLHWTLPPSVTPFTSEHQSLQLLLPTGR